MPQLELQTLVLYDISDDRTRTKVSEVCLDYGLARFQYSAFEGMLTRNRREELALRLGQLMGEHGGKATLVPICRRDYEDRIDVEITAAAANGRASSVELSVFAEGDDG